MKSVDHTSLFIFPKASSGGRKHDDRKALITVGKQLHVFVERRAVPLYVISTHLRVEQIVLTVYGSRSQMKGY
jgi:hypothetical protein